MSPAAFESHEIGTLPSSTCHWTHLLVHRVLPGSPLRAPGPGQTPHRHTEAPRAPHGGGEGAPPRERPLPRPDCLAAPPFTPGNDTNHLPLGNLSPGSSIWHPACRQAARTDDRNKVGGPGVLSRVLGRRARPRRSGGSWADSAGPGGRGGRAREDRHLLPVCSAPLPQPPTASGVSHVAAQPALVDARPGQESLSVSVPPRHGHLWPCSSGVQDGASCFARGPTQSARLGLRCSLGAHGHLSFLASCGP